MVSWIPEENILIFKMTDETGTFHRGCFNTLMCLNLQTIQSRAAGTGGPWPNAVCGVGILPLRCQAQLRPPHSEPTWRGAARLELLLACVDMADNESNDNAAIFSVCHSFEMFFAPVQAF